MPELLSPKQVARAVGVSEASLKRWCDKGLLEVRRTVGGHRRIPFSSVVQFIRKSGHPLVRPEVLGLPSSSGKGDVTLERAAEHLLASLCDGDEDRVVQLIFDLYLARFSASEICDKVVADAFHRIGERWQHGTLVLFQERLAGQLASRALHRLEISLPPPASTAFAAFGATLAGDPYGLPTQMVALVLREHGWRASSFGVGIPASDLALAIQRGTPRLIWLSVSTIRAVDEFLNDIRTLYDVAGRAGAALVLGGRALTADVRPQIQYAAFCDTMAHLSSYVRSLQAAPALGNRV